MTSEQRKNKRRQAHRNFAKSHWREIASANEVTGVFSNENLSRMRRGMAPRRLALLRNKATGETVEFHAPLELHHVFGLQEDTPQEEQTIVELYPWQHAACDDSRHFNWEFVQWVGFQ